MMGSMWVVVGGYKESLKVKQRQDYKLLAISKPYLALPLLTPSLQTPSYLPLTPPAPTLPRGPHGTE